MAKFGYVTTFSNEIEITYAANQNSNGLSIYVVHSRNQKTQTEVGSLSRGSSLGGLFDEDWRNGGSATARRVS